MKNTLCCCLVFQCLYKSFGATLLAADSAHFDKFVKNIMQKPEINDSIERPANVDECPTSMKSLFDYYFDCNRAGWIAYEWIVPPYIHDVNLKFNEIFVPTADSVRISQMLNQLNNVCYTRTRNLTEFRTKPRKSDWKCIEMGISSNWFSILSLRLSSCCFSFSFVSPNPD